jgi:hypothetical protein
VCVCVCVYIYIHYNILHLLRPVISSGLNYTLPVASFLQVEHQPIYTRLAAFNTMGRGDYAVVSLAPTIPAPPAPSLLFFDAATNSGASRVARAPSDLP